MLKIKINKIMLFVRHRVADIINEGRTINNEFDYRQIKDDTKMLFRDYDKERRRQELYEKIMNNILNNRLSKQIISKDVINSLEYIVIMSTGLALTTNRG